MYEEKPISKTQSWPNTVPSLVKDFMAAGVQRDMVLVLHSSLRSLGWVNGGPAAVILALEEILGPRGTLIMPTHTGHLSDPAEWLHPPIPEAWWEIVRQTMPAFDPDLSQTRGMGAIPETFRKQSGVMRSFHPHVSFAAWGAHAADVTANHALPDSLGEQSPLARIYDLDGRVLLLGVGHANNTSLHLAEYRANFAGKRRIMRGAPLCVDGKQQWVQFSDVDVDSDDFETIGDAFGQETGLVLCGKVGYAETLFMPQRALVDFGVRWMEANRKS